MTKRHRRPPHIGSIGPDPLANDPGRPRYHAAAVARTIAFITGQPVDPFFGCAFPTCACTGHCAIHASLTPTETP